MALSSAATVAGALAHQPHGRVTHAQTEERSARSEPVDGGDGSGDDGGMSHHGVLDEGAEADRLRARQGVGEQDVGILHQ